MAYKKKNEYGGGIIKTSNTKLENIKSVKSDLDSLIMVDEVKIKNYQFDIEDLYNTIMKPSRK